MAALDDPASRRAVDAERAFLAELGGDCRLPVGAWATLGDDGIDLRAVLAADGVVHRWRATGDDADPLGRRAARSLLDLAGSVPEPS